MIRSFPMQVVKISHVVSQQNPCERLGEIEYFRIWYPILIELADGYHIMSVAA